MSIAPEYVTPEEVRDRQLKVYLTSEAGSVNLWPNANGDGLKLHSKVDGLGVADSENTMTSLASGGAIMRHQRLKEGDMQLPIQIRSNSKRARNDLKTQLEQVLQPAKGPVYVHVLDPYSGDTRIRTAYYRTGLGQPEWSGPRSALYGVTLDYAEPWWRGVNRGRKVKVAERKKPFITARSVAPAEGATVHRESRPPTSSDAGSNGDVWYVGANAEPEKVTRRNLAPNPSFESVGGWFAGGGTLTYNTSFKDRMWDGQTSGSTIAQVAADGSSSYLTLTQHSSTRPTVAPGQWVGVAVFVAHDPSGVLGVRSDVVCSGSATTYHTSGDFVSSPFYPGRRIVYAFQVPASAARAQLRVQMYSGSATSLPAGRRLWVDDAVMVVAESEAEAEAAVATYFDGDTPPSGNKLYRWTGPAHASTSEEFTPATAFKPTEKYVHDGSGWVKQQPNPAIPFFPIFVYSSVVEGVYTLNIEGDEIAWPTWTIHPPGKDLLIENMTTGDKLFIEGEIFEPLTIVTDPHNQDIYSDTWNKGEWWNRVDIKQGTLFPLAAGRNKIKITMVGANLESYVEYSYQEMWRAPY